MSTQEHTLPARNHLLTVTEHHSRTNDSEVVRVDIKDMAFLVVEHLGSQDSVVVDMEYPDGYRVRLEHFHYARGEGKMGESTTPEPETPDTPDEGGNGEEGGSGGEEGSAEE